MPAGDPHVGLAPDTGQVVPGRRAVIVSIMVLLLVVLDIKLSGPLVHLDHRVGTRMQQWDLREHTWPRRLLTIGLYFGQRGVVLPAAVLLTGWVSWRTHTSEPLVRLVVAVVSLAVVVYGFKLGLARNAPIQVADGVAAGHGASFPSGHMANAVLLWGLADWSLRHRPDGQWSDGQWSGGQWPSPALLRRAVRAGRWIAPVAILVAMTLLNYHWVSDFIGGAAIGVVLLALALSPRLREVAHWIDRRHPGGRGSSTHR